MVKDLILKMLQKVYVTSMLDIVTIIPGADGPEDMRFGKDEQQVVVWKGVSRELIEAVYSMIDEGKITMLAVDSSYYRVLNAEFHKQLAETADARKQRAVAVCDRLLAAPRATMDDMFLGKKCENESWMPIMLVLRPASNNRTERILYDA